MGGKTLLLTVSLPDFYVDDLPGAAEEYYDGDMLECLHEEAGLVSSTARMFFVVGSKEGCDLIDNRAVIVRAEVVASESNHDEPEDERLTWMLYKWRAPRPPEPDE